MTPQRVAALLLLGLAGLSPRLRAQERAVTLADAIRLSERVQPAVVRAAGDLETAAAQRRSAWGAYLPSLTASSSASSFFSEGPSRIDPVTGQLLSGNTLQPEPQHLALGQRGPLHRLPARRRDASAARANQTAAEASFVDARFQQALATTNQFLDALAAQQLVRVRETSVRRAEEQLKTSVAKLRAGSATRSDSLRSLVTLGNARLELIRARTDLATAEAGLARLIGETGRVQGDATTRRSTRSMAAPDTAALRAEAEAKSPRIQSAERRGRCRAGRPQGLPRGLLAQPLALGQHRRGTPAGRTTTTCSTSGSSVSASAGTCSTGSTASSASRSGPRPPRWPTRPRPTSGGRWPRS